MGARDGSGQAGLFPAAGHLPDREGRQK